MMWMKSQWGRAPLNLWVGCELLSVKCGLCLGPGNEGPSSLPPSSGLTSLVWGTRLCPLWFPLSQARWRPVVTANRGAKSWREGWGGGSCESVLTSSQFDRTIFSPKHSLVPLWGWISASWMVLSIFLGNSQQFIILENSEFGDKTVYLLSFHGPWEEYSKSTPKSFCLWP